MNVYEFADKYLQPYQIHGDEIIPEYCPFCNGGPKREKHKFALNITKKVFNCKRLNSCGRTGTFWELCKEFGEEVKMNEANYHRNNKKPKVYIEPKVATTPFGSKIEEYFKSRGISPQTLEKRGVSEHKGAIAFPYYEKGKLVLVKYRTPEKEPKHWREEGGKPVFWGMDLCEFQHPLVITEGEPDTIALEEAGVKNAVSVPSGADDLTCIENCWEWLEKFKEIIIWGDNDPAGKVMIDKLIKRLGQFRCYLVQSKYKDANDHLMAEGVESVRKAVENKVEVPAAGIKRLADVKRLDYSQIERVQSGIKKLDLILGGFRMGELTVWTGINSSGKSTFLGQMLIESIDQGFPVFAYSGELTQSLFKEWIQLQMAGPENIVYEYDPVECSNISMVKEDVIQKLEEWYRNMFYIYDSFTTTESVKILDLCKIAARRYDCKIFLIDNLMTTGSDGIKSDNFYQAQSAFVGNLVEFAKIYNVHVHLVAHPRKTVGMLTKMDVAGSANITDRADNVIAMHRFSREEKDGDEYRERYMGFDALLQVFKNRFRGKQDVEFGLKYDYDCKRFYLPDDQEVRTKKYSWEIDNFVNLNELEVEIS